MANYNVKKIENTNTMITTLSTVCKKQSTAENRFTRFLESYNSMFTETMLRCFMNIKAIGYVNGELVSQAVIEENEYTMCVQITDDTYIVTIEFHHNENTTHYKSLANTIVSNNEESDTTETVNNDTNETAETDNNEESDTQLIKESVDGLYNVFHKELINRFVDGINNGFENDNYKQARECFEKVVQILPDGYEICFTTKFNIDMTKVDEPIYNHRYKIIRDKTGLMFTIHKYSEVYHKFKPLKPETKITDIIRYIYFRTFDSVCRVFKHDSTGGGEKNER